ncbi:MAG TPA: DUF3604 domain-containing protein [Acidimicrobiales bacterium]|nr:DUF3604 domain-containing protein [Acidimicrobiales bacterium]
MQRRTVLKALALAGGGLAMRPVLASALGGVPGSAGAARRSRLDPSGSLLLVHSDLHNHSFISGDAEGDPFSALKRLRAAGLDVACMTEHAVSGKDHGQYTCAKWQDGGCRFIEGINENDWETMAKIADAAYEPGAFVSFRGFEYSTPTVGHINVWFGSDFTDPAHEAALATPRAISQMWRVFPSSKPVADQFQNAPDTATILPFYDWLTQKPGSEPFGGGSDAIGSFNHPGYFGNFQSFVYHSGAAKQIFLIEAFNAITYNQDQSHGHTATDYFWYGRDQGLPQPFNACFNAGWQVGFTGVSDEHSGVYGQTGKGRGGLYVNSLTRQGVRRAIMSRRSFGTREAGLRLDATANGAPMGSELALPKGHPVSIRLDIDRGPQWSGKKLFVQVIGPGRSDPTLLDVVPITVPGPGEPVISFTAKPNGAWMFLRITDPARPIDPLGVAPFEKAAYGGASAYASPWFFKRA